MKRKLWILAVMIMTVLLFSAAAAQEATVTEMVMPDEESFSIIPDVYISGSTDPIIISFVPSPSISLTTI